MPVEVFDRRSWALAAAAMLLAACERSPEDSDRCRGSLKVARLALARGDLSVARQWHKNATLQCPRSLQNGVADLQEEIRAGQSAPASSGR